MCACDIGSGVSDGITSGGGVISGVEMCALAYFPLEGGWLI